MLSSHHFESNSFKVRISIKLFARFYFRSSLDKIHTEICSIKSTPIWHEHKTICSKLKPFFIEHNLSIDLRSFPIWFSRFKIYYLLDDFGSTGIQKKTVWRQLVVFYYYIFLSFGVSRVNRVIFLLSHRLKYAAR